ncbi:MAG: transcription termination factor Rho [Eubacteriales bacterium]|nr:transcription termination factor Rho [Eubacteriales bacterium]
MQTLEELKVMTVAQLRKYAKEQGIELVTNMAKQAIIDKIYAAQPKPEEKSESEQQKKVPARRALIISDESDDIPVMTVNTRSRSAQAPIKPAAPAVSAPRPTPQPPKGNKPAFTLQGARAWHNPQPFATQQTGSKYAPSLGTPLIAGDTKPAYKPAFTRFGPDVSAQPEIAPQSPQPQHVFRPAYAQQEPRRTLVPKPSQPSGMPGDTYFPSSPLNARESRAEDNGAPEFLSAGDVGEGAGVLDIHPDGYGFLRAGNYLPSLKDIYVSNAQIRRFALRNGDYIEGKTRPQREMDRYSALLFINKINGEEVTGRPPRRDFDKLTAIYPHRRIKLSSRTHKNLALRMIDLFSPIGFGQRALMVVPRQMDTAAFFGAVAASTKENYPELTAMLLLVDEKPEEITAIKNKVDAEILYTTFDEPPENTARVSDMVVERAKRLAESGRDVLLMLNDFTALCRAYNNMMPQSARELRGGLVAGALTKPKQLLGAARNLKEGGSITVVAAIIGEEEGTLGSAVMDEVQSVVNAKVIFDDALHISGVEPPYSLQKSQTTQGNALLTRDESEVVGHVRELTKGRSDEEAGRLILSMMEKTDTNREFTTRFDSWMEIEKQG